MSKKCTKCGVLKPLSDYYRDRKAKDGRATRCISCYKQYRKLNRRKLAESQRRTKEKYREKYRQKDRESHRARYLKSKYGLDLSQLEQLKQSQGNRCAICRTLLLGGRQEAIDHCHDSGRLRGLLCNNCNTGLGMLRENLEIINATAEYVTKHSWMKGAK